MLRHAFWSGDIPYRKWHRIMRAGDITGHSAIFRQSFRHLPMRWLFAELGEDMFLRLWPKVRETLFYGDLDAIGCLRRDAWDALWGIHAVGDSQYPLSDGLDVIRIGRKRRQVLREAIRDVGVNIYQVSKRLKRDYSRVYKDVKRLEEAGLLRVIQENTARGRVNRLAPIHSINTKLAGF